MALFVLIGIAVAEDVGDSNILFKEEKNLTFKMDQKVSGTGFFATYKYSLMPDALGTVGSLFNGVEAKNQAHGSGTIDTESQISAESSYKNESSLNIEPDEEEVFSGGEEVEITEEFEEESTSIVGIKEEGNTTYASAAMAIGAGYYAARPVAFNSLLKDETQIKNRNGFNSMDYRVEGARGLNKALDAQSDATDTTMKVVLDIINGKAHFGVLQLAGIPRDEGADEEEEGEEEEEIPTLGLAMKTWQKPLIYVDEDYLGTYHMEKNMALTTSSDEEEKDDSWLPCCSAGYLALPPYYQKGSRGFGSNIKGIFDCTCFKAPGEAQFPRG